MLFLDLNIEKEVLNDLKSKQLKLIDSITSTHLEKVREYLDSQVKKDEVVYISKLREESKLKKDNNYNIEINSLKSLNNELKKQKQLLNDEKVKNKKTLEEEIFISDCYKYICKTISKPVSNLNEYNNLLISEDNLFLSKFETIYLI